MCHSRMGSWLPGFHRQSAGNNTSFYRCGTEMKSLDESELWSECRQPPMHIKSCYFICVPQLE